LGNLVKKVIEYFKALGESNMQIDSISQKVLVETEKVEIKKR
jgi:hypothetical protein